MSANTRFKALNVLIVDDFNNFRMTLNKIMYELGFRNIDSVATGEEASTLTDKNHYDLILCDYNLGQGKNGQQLLEEIRLKGSLKPSDIFILLSAETSRNVVMSAYDCEPDAYLTKPITIKVIQQRLRRLLNRRQELLTIYTSVEKGDTDNTISLLTAAIKDGSRYSMDCQKLLADLYIQTQRLDEAEQVYRSVLEMRALDWAQVGLARVKITKGETQTAVQWLNSIIENNPSCMKAYDVLSLALEQLNDNDNLQRNLERAVEMSPMSIGRQVSLAKTALANGDAEVAAKAYNKTIKYSANSCHDTIENQLDFAKSVARLFDQDEAKAADMAKKAMQVLSNLEDRYEVDFEFKLNAQLLESQLLALQGNTKKAKTLLDTVTDTIDEPDSVGVDVEIEVVNTMIANDQQTLAHAKLQEMIERYRDDEPALEKIDPLLSEPVSKKGKKILAQVNKKGINAYKAMEYEAAITHFIRVEKRYPRYLGIKLNLAQALIGKIRKEGADEDSVYRCNTIFDVIKRYIDPANSQFNRYLQLQDMLRTVTTPQQEQA